MLQWFFHASSVWQFCNTLAMRQNYGGNMEAIIAGKFTGMNKSSNA
jgi:hypothetical protein